MKNLIFALIAIVSIQAPAQFLDPKSKDDQLHFVAGMASGEFGSLLNQATFELECDLCTRLGFGLLVLSGKETWDVANGGSFDTGEIASGMIGVGFGYLIERIVHWLDVPKAVGSFINIFLPIIFMGKVTLNL